MGVLKGCKVGEIGGNYSTVLDIFQMKRAKGRQPGKDAMYEKQEV